ncbi:MAG TPA: GH25 family lysozyme, partial [Candidatus Limnocylindrales bacterium]
LRVRPDPPRRPRHRSSSAVAVVAFALLIAARVVVAPSSAFAATPMAAACSGVNLRTAPATTATVATQIGQGTQVGVVATVGGGTWRATCPGPVAGSSWYEISELNGQPVSALFGVGLVYGATGLFTGVVPAPTPTPDPNAVPTPTPDPNAVPTATPTPTPDPNAVPTPTPDPNATPIPPLPPIPTPTPFLNPLWTEGIDASHWQGTVDWAAVAGAGKRFAYIKASEQRDLVDATYAINRAQARAAGLFVGAYHFARPDAIPGDAVAEADHFLDTAQPVAGELLPVLDLEDSGGLPQAALQDWVRTYLDRIRERLGVLGVIYVSPTFWRNAMGDTTWFADNGYRTLWVAHWTSAIAPSPPAANWGTYGWTFWQYTSSGVVSGIGGRVDLDRYNGTDLTPVLIPSSPFQPTQQAPTLDLAATLLATTYREPLTVNAVLAPLGATRTIEIQRRSPVDADWASIAQLPTDAAGTATYSYGPPYNTQFRAVWAGSSDLSAATSPPVSVVVRHAIRFPAGGTVRTVARGTRITYTATVRPLAPSGGQRVTFLIYRRVGGVWTYRTSATVSADEVGRATFRWRWTQGEWYIRARANATLYNAAALSPIARVTVR